MVVLESEGEVIMQLAILLRVLVALESSTDLRQSDLSSFNKPTIMRLLDRRFRPLVKDVDRFGCHVDVWGVQG